MKPMVPAVVNGPETAKVEVATDCTAAVPAPYMSWPEVKEVWPVPPPPTVRVPLIEGVKVWVLPEPVMVRAVVRPLKEPVEVAKVTVGPEEVWPVGPIACTAEVMSPRDEVAVSA
jgi:hypothetical protein